MTKDIAASDIPATILCNGLQKINLSFTIAFHNDIVHVLNVFNMIVSMNKYINLLNIKIIR